MAFIQDLDDRGGTALVNRALTTFPVSTEQIIHPERWPNDTPQPVDVPDLGPALGAGWRDLDVMTVGEVWLQLMLELRLDADDAGRAATGWDGGLYRAWTDGSRTAVVLRTVWDSPEDAQEFADAMGAVDRRVGVRRPAGRRARRRRLRERRVDARRAAIGARGRPVAVLAVSVDWRFRSRPVRRHAVTKYVYDFSEGNKDMKDLLGGKGANLAEMTNMGLPVPPGFTITTEACLKFLANDGAPPEMLQEAGEHLVRLQEAMGKNLGDPDDPLLVSVRSGAKFSMPGMMDTVLNLGLNDGSVKGLAKQMGDDVRFANDAYRRFIQMFGKIVMDVPADAFEHALDEAKERKGPAPRTRIWTPTTWPS